MPDTTESIPQSRTWIFALLAIACGSDRTELLTPRPANPPLSESPAGFRKVTLDAAPGEPIGLALLPGDRILHTTRTGTVWLHEPDGEKRSAATLPVYSHDEEGLQGIAIDPEFEQNGWVYLYYSPRLETPVDDPSTLDRDEGEAPFDGPSEDWASRFRGRMRLSRFEFVADSLDLQTEQIILEIPTDRGICCHLGGQIDFDGDGNLYLSTGDDTNPFFSSGFSPIDERSARHPAFDAQRSAANTNDLRGKLLRIRVAADGSYTSPTGNLFPPGVERTRPEIYVMGLRNPFRFGVERSSGRVYLADYAPDAAADDAARGPAGAGKWMIIDQASNYGWPYCSTPDRPYLDFDFETGRSSGPFDCAHTSNESPHNTGLQELPPVTAPEVFYSYGASSAHPELGTGGIGPMAGPVYVYDPENPSSRKWPAEYANAPVFYEWTRDFIGVFHLENGASVSRLERLTQGFDVANPIDAEFGSDGALYVLEYGDGYFTANPNAQLSRIEFSAAQP